MNTAGYAELQKIQSIGSLINQNTIDYRNTSDPFESIERIC
ncbi:helix-hairpin-helix domain-containing protein [Alteribacillus persepolensis]